MNNIDSRFIEEISKVMPEDFKDWFQNSPEELPLIAKSTIKHLRKENEMLWKMIDDVHTALDTSKYYPKL